MSWFSKPTTVTVSLPHPAQDVVGVGFAPNRTDNMIILFCGTTYTYLDANEARNLAQRLVEASHR